MSSIRGEVVTEPVCLCSVPGTRDGAGSGGGRDVPKLQHHLKPWGALGWAVLPVQEGCALGTASRWRFGLLCDRVLPSALPVSASHPCWGKLTSKTGAMDTKLDAIFGYLIFLHYLTIFRLPAAGPQFLICCMCSQQKQ